MVKVRVFITRRAAMRSEFSEDPYCLALFDACPFLATMKAPPAPGGQALDKARGRKPRTASRRFRTGEALWAIECRARLQGRSNHPEPSALRRRARASPSAWSRIWYAC